MIGYCGCQDIAWQVAGFIVSVVAIVFTWYSARRQNAEAAKENKISLLNRRMEYLDLLQVLSKCLSVAGASAMQCSMDGLFSPMGFSSRMEKFMKSNPVLVRLLQEGSVDFSITGKSFFEESSCIIVKKLNEGEYIFKSADIKTAIESLRCVFKLAGGWSQDNGVIIGPPGECDLYASVKMAMIAMETAVNAGIIEMKI